jgi:hypothetical protein
MGVFRWDDKELQPWFAEEARHDLISLSWRSKFDTTTMYVVDNILPWLLSKIYHRAKVSTIAIDTLDLTLKTRNCSLSVYIGWIAWNNPACSF